MDWMAGVIDGRAFLCLGSNQLEDLCLYVPWQASLPGVFSLRSLWFLDGKNHSLLLSR